MAYRVPTLVGLFRLPDPTEVGTLNTCYAAQLAQSQASDYNASLSKCTKSVAQVVALEHCQRGTEIG